MFGKRESCEEILSFMAPLSLLIGLVVPLQQGLALDDYGHAQRGEKCLSRQ
jgi:hypothetical protein